MIKANNKKICIVVSSLGKGGAERSSALLSKMLYQAGFNVHIVSVLDQIDFSYEGTLLNLGLLKKKNDTALGRIQRLIVFKKYINKEDFDFIIDNRTRVGFFKEFIISRLIYGSKKAIYNIHSYKTDRYIHPNPFLAKIIYGSAYKMVTVSNAIANRIKEKYNFRNVSVIFNAVNTELNNKQTIAINPVDDYILFFGRLDDDVKNISLLLDGYAKSKLPDNQVKLKILGDGEDAEKLKTKSTNLGLERSVEFLPFNSNPFSIVQNALYTVLTSRYEGFPMVITESLTLGTPVISVDCKSGPNEIIVNTFNGLMVENYNPEALADAMNQFFEDKELYLHCKSNSKASVAHFSEEIIVQQWQTLLN